MNEILKLLAQYPIALIILGGLFVLLLLSITIIYLVAFFQGREISFYPPKIGSRLTIKEKRETKNTTAKDNEAKNNQPLVLTLKRSEISISGPASSDCRRLQISTDKIRDFILSESIRHPALFTTSFSSIPLAFENNVIFLSWDGTQANIERILHRSNAYPTNETWFVCVSLYRQATTLPYRNKETKALFSETESRHTINLYKKLLRNIKGFIEHNKEKTEKIGDISIFESLLDEAEFSLFNDNFDIGIVRLEALLSSIHKFLLQNAPQAEAKNTQKTEFSTPKLSGEGEKSILLVDDDVQTLNAYKEIITKLGYRITIAQSGEEAFKAMVENHYDLVITDMVMPTLDGREVAIGTKTISPKTKIMLLSGNTSLDNLKKTFETPNDAFISKSDKLSELLTCIRSLLMEETAYR